MPLSRRLCTSVAIAAIAGVACDTQFRRLNAPPQGDTQRPSQLQPFFSQMVDQAGASDMSVADIHFVPHTSELNSTGTMRLDSLATTLGTYGGTVRYETDSRDPKVIDERVAHVREYLVTTGIDMARVTVAAGPAGSHRTRAADAIRIMYEGTADDSADAEGGGAQAGGAAGAGGAGAGR